MVSCEALLRKRLQKAAAANKKVKLEKLREEIVAKLVEAGKPESKARKIFDAKLALPDFVQHGPFVKLSGGEGGEKEDVAPKGTKRKSKDDGKAQSTDSANAKKSKSGGEVTQNGSGEIKPASKPFPGPKGGSHYSVVRMMDSASAEAFRKEHRIELVGDGANAFNPVASFVDTGFAPDVLKACSKFERPTPIQSQCWPVLASGRDIIGVAETGSGKTLAFFLPAVAYVRQAGKAKPGETRVLVLAPTRELAMQTEQVCAEAGANCGLRCVCIYGGVPKGPQCQAVREGAQVVVATPGRLLDLESMGALSLKGVCYLVLDEADRMLDLGFEKDVRSIISSTPSSRRTAMFTATWPDSVRALAEEFLANPIRVNVGSESLSANHRVTQHVEVLDQQQKEGRLVDLLTKYKPSMNNRVLVFALYKKEAARVEQTLQRRGFDCIAIHGDQTQAVRSASLQSFKEGKVPLLVATDVAARGLDIPLVQVVINFTFPLTIEDYVHRIGRTGRGGKTGIAHTFFTNFDKAHAGALQNILREANQDVPNDLLRFGSAVKKKEHKMYGSFGPADGAPMKAATRIVFD